MNSSIKNFQFLGVYHTHQIEPNKLLTSPVKARGAGTGFINNSAVIPWHIASNLVTTSWIKKYKCRGLFSNLTEHPNSLPELGLLTITTNTADQEQVRKASISLTSYHEPLIKREFLGLLSKFMTKPLYFAYLVDMPFQSTQKKKQHMRKKEGKPETTALCFWSTLRSTLSRLGYQSLRWVSGMCDHSMLK